MKLIATDNRGRSTVGDKLIRENMTEAECNAEAAKRNERLNDQSQWFYLAVADDYELFEARR